MRLSIPSLGRPHTQITIRSAEAISYAVPVDLSSEDTQRTAAPLNYLIVIAGEAANGTQFHGFGEAQPRWRQTGDAHDMSWPFLEGTLDGLVGRSLNLQDPLPELNELVNSFESAAGPEETEPIPRFRATITGLEACLLDLMSRAKGMTVADLLGRRSVRKSKMPPLMKQRLPEDMELFLATRQNGRNRELRLVGSGDLDADLAHVRLAARTRGTLHRRGSNDPIWMNFEGRLDLVQARRAVDEIAMSSQDDIMPSAVILQNPLPREDFLGCLALQQYADEICAQVARAVTIKILPRNVGPRATEQLLAEGHAALRMLNVRPAQIGGIMRTKQLIESANLRSDAALLVTHFPGASRVTQMLHRDVSNVLPGVQYLATTADIEKRFRLSHRSSTWRRSPVLRRGVGLRVDYQALVHRSRNRTFKPQPPPTQSGDTHPNTYDDVDFIAPIGAYAVHGHIVEREALAYGLNSWRFTKSSFVATTDSGNEIIPFRRSRWPLSGVTAASVAKHKEATRILLKRAGCPVPPGRTFAGEDHQGARDFAARIGYPVVVKPAEGSMGVGVVANIGSPDELQTALSMLGRTVHGHDDFIVEKHVSGSDYRIMVIGSEVVAAVKRRPASIIGDGVQTVGQLIMQKNVDRQSNPHLGPLRIQWNEATQHELRKSGYSFDEVIPLGQRVQLSSTSNLTQGGDSIDVLQELHPSIIESAIRATRAVPGMEYCGVDFLLEDHTQPLSAQGGAICELNVMAALPVGEYPAYGAPRPLAERFIKECAGAFDLKVRPTRAEHLQLELVIRGGVTGVGYRRWFARRAANFGLTGWIRREDERELRARVSGPTAPVSALVTAAILGPPKAAPESIYSTHWEGMTHQGFEILDEQNGFRATDDEEVWAEPADALTDEGSDSQTLENDGEVL